MTQNLCCGCQSLSYKNLVRIGGVTHHRPVSFIKHAFASKDGCPLCGLIWATIRDCGDRHDPGHASRLEDDDTDAIIRLDMIDSLFPFRIDGHVHVTLSKRKTEAGEPSMQMGRNIMKRLLWPGSHLPNKVQQARSILRRIPFGQKSLHMSAMGSSRSAP